MQYNPSRYYNSLFNSMGKACILRHHNNIYLQACRFFLLLLVFFSTPLVNLSAIDFAWHFPSYFHNCCIKAWSQDFLELTRSCLFSAFVCTKLLNKQMCWSGTNWRWKVEFCLAKRLAIRLLFFWKFHHHQCNHHLLEMTQGSKGWEVKWSD